MAPAPPYQDAAETTPPFFQGIFFIARELYRMYFCDSPLMSLSSRTLAYCPYLMLACVACMALKLGYGIGSEPSLGARWGALYVCMSQGPPGGPPGGQVGLRHFPSWHLEPCWQLEQGKQLV